MGLVPRKYYINDDFIECFIEILDIKILTRFHSKFFLFSYTMAQVGFFSSTFSYFGWEYFSEPFVLRLEIPWANFKLILPILMWFWQYQIAAIPTRYADENNENRKANLIFWYLIIFDSFALLQCLVFLHVHTLFVSNRLSTCLNRLGNVYTKVTSVHSLVEQIFYLEPVLGKPDHYIGAAIEHLSGDGHSFLFSFEADLIEWVWCILGNINVAL